MTRLATYIYLSTEHLEPDVSQALTDKGPDSEERTRTGDWTDEVVVCEFAYGHWVRVVRPTDEDEESLAHHRERMERLPECLRDCMRHAEQFGARWILFDRDEEPIPGLRRYTW